MDELVSHKLRKKLETAVSPRRPIRFVTTDRPRSVIRDSEEEQTQTPQYKAE